LLPYIGEVVFVVFVGCIVGIGLDWIGLDWIGDWWHIRCCGDGYLGLRPYGASLLGSIKSEAL
jgi:hypothetical protein